eukprot:8047166-Alexandrium_andersonii.AAC.1
MDRTESIHGAERDADRTDRAEYLPSAEHRQPPTSHQQRTVAPRCTIPHYSCLLYTSPSPRD